MRKELFIVVLLTTIRIIFNRIVALIIYVFIIRRVIVEFVANWNSYIIRKQAKKSYIIAGKLLNTFYIRFFEGFYDF